MMDVLKFQAPRSQDLRQILSRGHWRGLVAALVMTLMMVTTLGQAQAEDNLDEELSQFWSVDRDLSVVQDRLFKREGRFGVGLYTGLMSSQPFLYYYPVGGRLSYNFTDAYGIELSGSFMDAGALTHQTQLSDFLDGRQAAFELATHTEDRFLWRASAVFQWSPLYGKFALLQRKLAHFDINFVAGMGVVGAERPNADRTDSSEEVLFEGIFGGGVHFFITRDVTLRLDGRFYLYRGAETPIAETNWQRMALPAEFLLGVSYLF